MDLRPASASSLTSRTVGSSARAIALSRRCLPQSLACFACSTPVVQAALRDLPAPATGATSSRRGQGVERRSVEALTYEGHRRNDEQGAHPAIISVQNFVDVQLLRRSRGGVARPTLERSRTKTSHHYALGGRFRCGYCQRRMEGAARRWGTYYRCVARTLVPGSPALTSHPKSVYLREMAVLGPVNRWLGELFDPDNLDRTMAALVASQGGDPGRRPLGSV